MQMLLPSRLGVSAWIREMSLMQRWDLDREEAPLFSLVLFRAAVCTVHRLESHHIPCSARICVNTHNMQ